MARRPRWCRRTSLGLDEPRERVRERGRAGRARSGAAAVDVTSCVLVAQPAGATLETVPMLLYFITGIVAYLLGSIPFGLILVRIFRKQDIREQGSGNIGATNVIRSGGKGLGAVTFLLDAAKGFVAVSACLADRPAHCTRRSSGTESGGHGSGLRHSRTYLHGVAAIQGRQRRRYRFRRLSRHRSVVCSWSSLLAFILVFALSRYVSLASILAAIGVSPCSVAAASRAADAVHDRRRDRAAAAHHRQASREHPPPARRDRIPLRQIEGRRRVSRIAIIGSGAWGTALAISLANRGNHTIALWSHTAEVAETIAQHRENRRYLPGLTVPDVVYRRQRISHTRSNRPRSSSASCLPLMCTRFTPAWLRIWRQAR